jgi:endonuclease YncB( thermonuclease family)
LTARIHPGIAALSVVIFVTAVLLILQNYHRRPTTTPVLRPQETTTLPHPQETTPAPHPQEILPETPKSQASLVGVARVIDGDTIDIRGTHIRLTGIDAPETKQTCQLGGETYACGQRATEALIVFLGARPVRCLETGKDRNQRIVARCHVDSVDVGSWMVEHGWAIAFRKYSMEYVGAEERARAQKLGMWAGTFTMPEEWRRTKR